MQFQEQMSKTMEEVAAQSSESTEMMKQILDKLNELTIQGTRHSEMMEKPESHTEAIERCASERTAPFPPSPPPPPQPYCGVSSTATTPSTTAVAAHAPAPIFSKRRAS